MKLKNFLEEKVNIHDFVLIEKSGWTVGHIIMDETRKHINSIDPNLLKNKVVNSKYVKDEKINRPVLKVEVSHHV